MTQYVHSKVQKIAASISDRKDNSAVLSIFVDGKLFGKLTFPSVA